MGGDLCTFWQAQKLKCSLYTLVWEKSVPATEAVQSGSFSAMLCISSWDNYFCIESTNVAYQRLSSKTLVEFFQSL